MTSASDRWPRDTGLVWVHLSCASIWSDPDGQHPPQSLTRLGWQSDTLLSANGILSVPDLCLLVLLD